MPLPKTSRNKKSSNTHKVVAAAKKSSTTARRGKGKIAPKLKDIFETAGFEHIESDGIHISFKERMGEIDHIFGWENIILLCEETTGKDVSGHCTKKAFFHNLIAEDLEEFFKIYRVRNPALDRYIRRGSFENSELEVRHLYYSEEHDVDEGVTKNSQPLIVLSRAQAAYFHSLAKTVERSAKYELMKFLRVNLSQVGDARASGRSVGFESFEAFALPAAHTNYPDGFAVVSFYADPNSLIKRAYVLRRDGWQNPNLSYQRFVKAEKLSEMREYLSRNGKVFVNNLIVTLPSSALMKAADGSIIEPSKLKKKKIVDLYLPIELGTVGIIDGQHRIMAYFEGVGEIDVKISSLRKRQNLLVTGLIFPSEYSAEMRVKFEAELFLSINNTQTGVATQLRQDLETIINPHVPLAMARSVINILASQGALAGMLQISQFDSSDKISVGSLGPYVVKSLMLEKGSFYKKWDPNGVRDLSIASQRAEFIAYVAEHLNRLLQGARIHLKDRWKSVPNGGVLSTTVVGGLLLLIERLFEEDFELEEFNYQGYFNGIYDFDFTGYTSSAWAKLSRAIYKELSL